MAYRYYFGAVIGLLFVVIYFPVLKWLYGRFTAEDTYYSHGFLIPFVTGYLVWQKRELIAATQDDTSWIGIVLIVAALGTHLASVMFFVFFTSGLSILVLLFGLSLLILGKQATRTLLFPIGFLIFMLPLPMDAINAISFPLKILVANVGSYLVNLFGVPVFRTGFFVETARGVLTVDNPCSGLRSLITFLALGSLMSYTTTISRPKKMIIFFSTIPIAILTNILRVTFLILVANAYGIDKAMANTLSHDMSGYVVFVTGGLLLFGLGRGLE